ncbi:MAG: rhamnogalacturonan acetylesterase [Bacteroidales bacterium]|nr:rhamnogalacturonan acetylesterase [Candidatus Liminaster caballi]
MSFASDALAQSDMPAMRRTFGGLADDNQVDDRTVDSIRSMRQDASSPYARPVPGSSRKGGNPVLFLVGNSTMRTGTKGDGSNGQWGWGAFACEWFDEERITVENHALGGTSSRTFYNDLWPAVRKGIRPGDYVIIELGHNDNGPYDSFTARASIPGIDPDTMLVVDLHDCRNRDWNGRRDTVYSYGQYMRMFINDVRARGGYPIISSLTPRNAWDNDSTVTRKLETFTRWGKAVAEEMQCPWIDLEGVAAGRMETAGHWTTSSFFTVLDKIHTSRFGARHNAMCAALAIMASPGCELKQYLKSPLAVKSVYPKRKPGCPVVFLCGDSTGQNEDRDTTGMWGWGSQMPLVFNTDVCTVYNAAKAGRSTRTYINEDRWLQVYNALQPGDIVFLQFGHNDIGGINTQKERGVIACSADTSHCYKLQDGSFELVYSFGWYLKKMVHDAREKGATPVLVSLTPRNIWPEPGEARPTDDSNGPCIERRNDSYGKWYREVIEWFRNEEGYELAFIDVHNITADYLDRLGKGGAAKYYNHDHTHTSLLGAQLNAYSIQQGMRSLGYDHLLTKDSNVRKQLKATEKVLTLKSAKK